MLQEEAGGFTRDEKEVECIDNLELEINVSNNQPELCPFKTPL